MNGNEGTLVLHTQEWGQEGCFYFLQQHNFSPVAKWSFAYL